MTADGSTSLPEAESQQFYAGAVRRIVRALVVWGAALTPIVGWVYGIPSAVGFAAGAGVSWVNFHALARGVERLAERIVEAESRERGTTLVARFLLRYLLVGAIAYAIFIGYPRGFRGFLFGLCVPVAAMLTEAIYEAHAAFWRGI